MIYLIDDNKTRQKDFGWTEERFAQYDNILVPLYTIDDVIYIGDKLYNDDNIILYHESFLDFTANKEKAVEQRNKLIEKAASNTSLSVAFFSGSQSSRTLVENTAFLPVAILYQNINVLIQQHSQNNGNLKYLLFGEKPEIEKELDEIITTANTNIEKDAAIIYGKNLFIRPNLRHIQNAIKGAKEVTIFPEVSDEKLSQKINEWLNQDEYDNIFIPLCFGQTLSDFNGLRLATHIRCTETPNQLKRIFIYSFIGIEYLLHNEFFNILKTKNVNLVDYSKKAFQTAATHKSSSLKPYELIKEMKMLELQPPKNYIDNHSIANEWAIYQWAKIIGVDLNDELKIVSDKIKHNLYFKYLRTLNHIDSSTLFRRERLKIKAKGKPRILLIDDEVHKGWNEILAYILTDVNDFYSDSIGENFKSCSSEEIIQESIKKIKEDEIDIVILDFRLNQGDFNNKTTEDVTSVKLLKEIKKINPGIQVIIFSATNKIWNYLILQDGGRGADGFVLKESPENSINNNFTSNSILSLINQLNNSIKRSFLIDFFKSLYTTKDNLLRLSFIDGTDYDIFILGLISQLKLVSEIAQKTDLLSESSLDIVFLNCFNFLEQYKEHYLRKKYYKYYLGQEETELKRYSKKKGVFYDNGLFLPNDKNDSPSWFNTLVSLFIDYFEICDINNSLISDLEVIKNARNDYIHNKKEHFNVDELRKIVRIIKTISHNMKE